jgi:uncharacterized protein (DUF302 family)
MEVTMNSSTIAIERISIISALPFDEVLAHIERGVGHPEMNRFRQAMRDAQTLSELEEIVGRAIGPSGLMEFACHDLGAVVRKECGSATPKSVRLIVGNPMIMKEMVKRVPDAGAYVPVTILIDERSDGVHLSYDRMQSLLAGYGDAEASRTAADLDTKVERLLMQAAVWPQSELASISRSS